MEHSSLVQPDFYAARANQHRAAFQRYERRSRLLSNLRGLSFAAWVIGWGFGFFGSAGVAAIAIGSLALAGFVGLVLYHPRIIEAESIEARWVATNEDAAKRVSGNAWHELPTTGESFRDPTHAYADDLDLFGKGSLFQRLCVGKTHLGQRQLAQFLLQAATPEQIRGRQAAVRALAPMLELRQELEVLARATQPPPKSGETATRTQYLEPLFSWGESAPALLNRTGLVHGARLLPVATTLIIALGYLHLIPSWLALVPFLAHVILLVASRQETAPMVAMLSTTEQSVLGVEALFLRLEQLPDGPLRQLLEGRLVTATTRPSVACKSLKRIAGWFEFRHNGLLYPFVNLYLLWDVQCGVAFDRWREQHGAQLRGWFDLLGEVEALSSLAGLHFDEPDTTFAELVEGDRAYFEAQSLGHPLIEVGRRVANDVATLSQGQGLLVTGSNMSGKSTFLRAMGLGAVLGLAGGPVCATRLRLTQLSVATSMRISDSLSAGVSHFYAELRKLKRVVDAGASNRPLFFLLDEILHGTNSLERRIGARFILSQLLRTNALGAVSTHDLALCELSGDLADRLRLVHFREDAQNGQMSFDYLLRQGPVTEGNALRLMRSLGLDVPLDAD